MSDQLPPGIGLIQVVQASTDPQAQIINALASFLTQYTAGRQLGLSPAELLLATMIARLLSLRR